MIFPKYIKKNDTIAVTAPSNGITDEIKIKRFNKGVEQLKNRGYNETNRQKGQAVYSSVSTEGRLFRYNQNQ